MQRKKNKIKNLFVRILVMYSVSILHTHVYTSSLFRVSMGVAWVHQFVSSTIKLLMRGMKEE